jgi:hypothetical protein
MWLKTYNTTYLRGRDLEDCGLRLSWARKLTQPSRNQCLGTVVCSCHFSTYRRLVQPRHKAKPYLNNNQSKKG